MRHVALALVATAVVTASAPAASSAGGTCTATFVAGAMHLCGPATARLSVFSGFTFRNGTCKRSLVAGDQSLVLELGALKPGSRTNGHLSYLKIEISGPLAHPTSGDVIAWHDGKRWAGVGESFKGSARGGTFVVTAIPANGGRRATGSFRC